MINIKPIAAPFFADIVSAEVSIPNYKLDQTETDISLKLFDEYGLLYKEIIQTLPDEVLHKWGTDNNYIINWAFKQNNIEKL